MKCDPKKVGVKLFYFRVSRKLFRVLENIDNLFNHYKT